MKHCLKILLILLINACGNEPSPEDEGNLYGVYGVLNPSLHQQEIFVTRAVPVIDDPIDPELFDPRIKGAEVVVEGNNQRVVFTEKDSGHYVSSSLQVVPGASYILTVNIPSGKILTSKTIVPLQPSLIEPVNFDSLHVDYQIDTTIDRFSYLQAKYLNKPLQVIWQGNAAAYSFIIVDTLQSPIQLGFVGYSSTPYLTLNKANLFLKSDEYVNHLKWYYTPPYLQYTDSGYVYNEPSTLAYETVLQIYAYDQGILDGAFCDIDLEDYGACNNTSNIQNGFGYFGSVNSYEQALKITVSYIYK